MRFEPGMPILVMIEDQQYEIRFSLRTLKDLQKDHGISPIQSAAETFTDLEKLSIMLYYGLKEKQSHIDLDWVQDHVDAGSLVDMLPAISYAMSHKQPASESPNEATPNGNGTGSPSGRLVDLTSV